MGKDLKGKDLGKGLTQRKDGKYSARYVDRNKKRIEQHFDKITEARQWLAKAKYEDEHTVISKGSQMTVDAWYNYWISDIKGKTIRYNTRRNYRERYQHNIKSILGNMLIGDVKPIDCQHVLNLMDNGYKGSTMEQCRLTMASLFYHAVENQIIPKSPMTSTVKCTKPIEAKVRFLTIEEQIKFLNVAKGTSNYFQYALILQTGLRMGELIGLKWEDIDFNKRIISVQRSMEFRYGDEDFRIGQPKSKSGYRTIPMTDETYNILKIKELENKDKVVLDQYKDFVFINRKGMPTKNSAYDTALYKLADKAGIERFSMHSLRHTFATRAIESGMRPKTLQKILGHSNLGITMNLYVHVTDEEKEKEMNKFAKGIQEQNLSAVC